MYMLRVWLSSTRGSAVEPASTRGARCQATRWGRTSMRTRLKPLTWTSQSAIESLPARGSPTSEMNMAAGGLDEFKTHLPPRFLLRSTLTRSLESPCRMSSELAQDSTSTSATAPVNAPAPGIISAPAEASSSCRERELVDQLERERESHRLQREGWDRERNLLIRPVQPASSGDYRPVGVFWVRGGRLSSFVATSRC